MDRVRQERDPDQFSTILLLLVPVEVPPSPFRSEVFLERECNALDVVPVPDRLEHGV